MLFIIQVTNIFANCPKSTLIGQYLEKGNVRSIHGFKIYQKPHVFRMIMFFLPSFYSAYTLMSFYENTVNLKYPVSDQRQLPSDLHIIIIRIALCDKSITIYIVNVAIKILNITPFYYRLCINISFFICTKMRAWFILNWVQNLRNVSWYV